jgi:hypothetical protein
MVETISPMVHGGRNASYFRAVALHTFGAGLSAAALGSVLGALGGWSGAPWGEVGLWVVAGIAVLYALRELAGVDVPLLDLDRQVPMWWRSFFGHDTAAFLYGLGLGFGFVTYLSFGTLIAVAATSFVSGSPTVGLLCMLPFGLARGLSVLAVQGGGPGPLLERLEDPALRMRAKLLNGLALVAIAVTTLWLGVNP